MNETDFIEHYGMSKEDAIAHYGVPGMKWGKRGAKATSDSGGSGAPSMGGGIDKQRLKALDKQSKAADKADRLNTIDSARSRNLTARKDWKAAKQTYKADKAVLGKREARKALNKVREQQLKDQETASQLRDGKEVALYVVAAIGVSVVSSLIANR